MPLLHIYALDTTLSFIYALQLVHNQLILHAEMFTCDKYLHAASVHITVNTFFWNLAAYQFDQDLFFHHLQKYGTLDLDFHYIHNVWH